MTFFLVVTAVVFPLLLLTHAERVADVMLGAEWSERMRAARDERRRRNPVGEGRRERLLALACYAPLALASFIAIVMYAHPVWWATVVLAVGLVAIPVHGWREKSEWELDPTETGDAA